MMSSHLKEPSPAGCMNSGYVEMNWGLMLHARLGRGSHGSSLWGNPWRHPGWVGRAYLFEVINPSAPAL